MTKRKPEAIYAGDKSGKVHPMIQRLEHAYGRAPLPPPTHPDQPSIIEYVPTVRPVAVKEAAIIKPRETTELLYVLYDKAWRTACRLDLVTIGSHEFWEGTAYKDEVPPHTLAVLEGAFGRWPDRSGQFAGATRGVFPTDREVQGVKPKPLTNLEGALLRLQSGTEMFHVRYRKKWWHVCRFYRAPYRNAAAKDVPNHPDVSIV